ncbi:MAG: iron-sulfur cluster insertion protein ErpA [Kiloniellales bacterium]
MNEVSPAAGQRQVFLTASAAKRVSQLLAAESQPNLMLRVAVSGGGCSGFQYGFSFDDTLGAEDRTFMRDGVTLVIDEASLDLLAGAEIDFVEELIGASFKINNPNASSSCGCGSSFSV